MLYRRIVPLIVAMLLAACAQTDDGDDSASFEPVASGTRVIAGTAAAGADEILNPTLAADRRIEAVRYIVPSLRCVRTAADDPLDIAATSGTPGETGSYYFVQPAAANRPLLIVLHDETFDFYESFIQRLAEADPERAGEILATPASPFGPWFNILSRDGAERRAERILASPLVGHALIRGWGVIVPADCWGDADGLRGEIVSYHVTGPRYGALMDEGAFRWVSNRWPHERTRQYIAATGTGARRAAHLLRTWPEQFAGLILDAPIDDVGGWLADPKPDFLDRYGDLDGWRADFDDFVATYWGSLAGSDAAAVSALLEPATAPAVWLAWSEADPRATPPVTSALRGALLELPADRVRATQFQTGSLRHLEDASTAESALQWIQNHRLADPAPLIE